MIVTPGGVRGSAPSCRGPSRYGTDTTCVRVESRPGESVWLDMGSGARSLPVGGQMLVLFTHYHLDHLCGLPSWSGLSRPGHRVVFAAPRMNRRTVRSVLAEWMAPPFWPMSLDRVPARVTFRTLESGGTRGFRWGGFRIRWVGVHHSEPCFAYRLDEERTGASLLFATDIEWSGSSRTQRDAFLRLAADPAPPSLLLCDGQYTPREYVRKRGWGHSRWTDAVVLARMTGAARLGIVHHDPDRSDEALARMERELRAMFPSAGLVRQGRRIRIPALVGRAPGRARAKDPAAATGEAPA